MFEFLTTDKITTQTDMWDRFSNFTFVIDETFNPVQNPFIWLKEPFHYILTLLLITPVLLPPHSITMACSDHHTKKRCMPNNEEDGLTPNRKIGMRLPFRLTTRKQQHDALTACDTAHLAHLSQTIIACNVTGSTAEASQGWGKAEKTVENMGCWKGCNQKYNTIMLPTR